MALQRRVPAHCCRTLHRIRSQRATSDELPCRASKSCYVSCRPNLSIWQPVLARQAEVEHDALLPALRRRADGKIRRLYVPVQISDVVKSCDALNHLHDQPHGGGGGEALACGRQAAAQLRQVHAQQLHDEVIVLLKVATMKVPAHVRAALHALQHGNLVTCERRVSRQRRENNLPQASTQLFCFPSAPPAAESQNNKPRPFRGMIMVSTCAYLDGGVLLRGQVDSSKDFAEGTWGIVTRLHQECNEYRKTTSTTDRWQNAQMLA